MHSWSFECFYTVDSFLALNQKNKPGFLGHCYQAIVVSIKTSLFTGHLGCEWQRAWHGDACFSDGCVSKDLRLFRITTDYNSLHCCCVAFFFMADISWL